MTVTLCSSFTWVPHLCVCFLSELLWLWSKYPLIEKNWTNKEDLFSQKVKSLVFTFHELEAHFKTRKTRRAAFSGFEKKLSRLLVNNSKEIKYFFCFLFSLFLDYNWIPKLAAILEKSLFCTFLFFFLIFIFLLVGG